MDGDETSFAERLRRYRERRGLTQAELAEAAGLTSRGVGALERGERRSPYPHTVRLLAAALGLSAEEQQALLRAARRGEARDEPGAVSARAGLSIPPTPLFGREHDVAAADRLLQQSGVHLLTLTGPGGVGKTRLSLQVAAEAGSRVDDVVVVSLASLTAPSQVPAAIAGALGLPDTGQAGTIAGIVAALRHRRSLLLLDNFEHLAPAAPFVADILSGCAQLKVLVTSRAALDIRYEHQYPVLPLAAPAPDEVDSGSDLLAYPSVRLFVERARAIDPAFSLERGDAAAVAEICRRLDGLPLAIELAAARTRVLAPRAMLTRLNSHLDLLSSGPGDLPSRQRTMRTTIAWSHDLLTPDEQRALRRLAVFVGGFTIEAAERVAAAEQRDALAMLNLVASLTSKNLVLREQGDDGFRFRMLETVREFALEQLEASGEAETMRQRHANWCLDLAEQGSAALLGLEQRRWQDRLDTEHANLRAALAWLRGRGDGEPALRLGAFLSRFWWYHGYCGEGERELEALLTLPGVSSDSPWWPAIMTGLGAMLHKRSDERRAVAVHQAAVAGWRALNHQPGLVQGLWTFGFALTDIDPAAAELAFAESLTLAQALDMDWFVGGSLWGLGVAARNLGNPRRAADLLEQALTKASRIGSPLAIAATLLSLGQVEHDQGNPTRAAALLEEALAVFRDISVPWGIVGCLEGLAALAHADGRAERSACLLGAAAALREAVGLPVSSVDDLAYARAVAAVRKSLGEPRFTVAWSAGQALRLSEAVTYALSEAAGTRSDHAAGGESIAIGT